MAAKARSAHVRFRPHFKTHQSLEIGRWFREFGVDAITVSSVGMAAFFAASETAMLFANKTKLRQLADTGNARAEAALNLALEREFGRIDILLNNVGVGLTLGYQVNSNLNLTFGYKSTVNDSAPTDLRMDGFMVTLVFGWHPTVEGMRRLKGEK